MAFMPEFSSWQPSERWNSGAAAALNPSHDSSWTPGARSFSNYIIYSPPQVAPPIIPQITPEELQRRTVERLQREAIEKQREKDKSGQVAPILSGGALYYDQVTPQQMATLPTYQREALESQRRAVQEQYESSTFTRRERILRGTW